MIVRIWRTRVSPGQEEAYERFAREQSLPMFRKQAGFLGVLFAGSGDERAVITMWRDRADVERLERSPSYRETVARIGASGLLSGPSSVEVLETHGYEILRALP